MGLQHVQADQTIVQQLQELQSPVSMRGLWQGEAGVCGRRHRIRCGFFPAACRRRCRRAGREYSVMTNQATELH